MDLKKILKLIEEKQDFVKKCSVAKRYYNNDNDILHTGVLVNNSEKDGVLRSADNRIPHSYHSILVDEKIAYMFTYPPIIDVDDNANNINDDINAVLGDRFVLELQSLCEEASNTGVAWLHYWLDDNNEFKFKKVNTEECIPIYDNTLEQNMTGFIRYYTTTEINQDKKEIYRIIEYWTNEDFTIYKIQNNYLSINGQSIEKEEYTHSFGEIPFIKFANNSQETSDLDKYKKQIDLMDKVMSGYANDIEDIQQIIYILENYGGQDTQEFLSDIKRYKVLPLQNNEIQGKGDLRTMQIDIPVQARSTLVDILKKQIYEYGQGLQQDVESVGNASGVALKFFYRKLDLKSGKTEVQFRQGIRKLIEAILKHLNKSYSKIQQTYTRNMISNDLENSQIAIQSLNVLPLKIIYQNHPWIDDVEEALKMHDEEIKNKYSMDIYNNSNEG